MFDFEFCNHKCMIWNHNFIVSTRFSNLKSYFPILKQRFWFGITISFLEPNVSDVGPLESEFLMVKSQSKVLKQKWQKGETYITIVFFSAPPAQRDEHAIMLCYFIQSLSTHNETFVVLDWTSWTQSFWFQIPKQKFWNKSGIRAKTKLHYVFFAPPARRDETWYHVYVSVMSGLFNRCQHVVPSGISLNRNSRWKKGSQFHPVSSGLI